MKLRFLGKDSTPNDSPTLYETDRDTLLVRVPEGETVVEVPKRLMKYLPEDAHGEGDG